VNKEKEDRTSNRSFPVPVHPKLAPWNQLGRLCEKKEKKRKIRRQSSRSTSTFSFLVLSEKGGRKVPPHQANLFSSWNGFLL